MEKIRGYTEGIIWLDDFAFVPIKRNSSLEYKLKSKFINLELLKRNNKIRIKEFVRYSYGRK